MKSLLFTFLSLFIVAEFAIAQSSGYSNVANGESSKVNKTETSLADSRKLNDSLKQIALTAEIDALRKQLKAQSDANQAQIDQLKAKSESNQSQIDQLKVDNARTKIAGTVNRPVDNSLVIGQLKARSDTNQVQIDQLRAELAKAKDTEASIMSARKLNDSLLLANMSGSEVKLAQLKARSESNQAQIDQLKVDNARTKIAGTVNRPVDNSLVIAQLKAQSDTNQALIHQLKQELAKSKEAEMATEDSRRLKDSLLRHFLIAETDALLTQLKAKSDTNQVQFDRLKLELESGKTAGRTTSSKKENDEVIAQLKAKSDTYQVQIDQLKAELEKAKEAEKAVNDSRKSKDSLELVNSHASDVKLALLKAKSESNQTQIDQLKVDNARAKISGTLTSPHTDNTVMIGQLRVKSDTTQAQIDRLKMELAKVKNVDVKTSPDSDYGELIAQLKTQSENSQAQIDMLVETITKSREEMPRTSDSKKAEAIDKMPPTKDYDEVIAQLKTQSDNNQAMIDKLVETISKTRDEMAKSADSKKAEALDKTPPAKDYGDVITQLKTQSDNNQAQIDMLVETITKTREEEPKSADSKKSVAVETEVLEVQLVEKANSEEAAGKLNPEPEKTTKSVSDQPIPVASNPGVPSYKTDRFVDEKGGPAGNGYYVVIGSFGSKENAERFKAASIIKGHRNTKIIQNKITKMYNIFALKTNNKKDADLERAKYKGEYSNVWVLKLE
ncbi:MAG: SPOR domain-containing protein [Bacteroidota bacterium]|nr:SPOR domain-containing protein [Bacteroidota bacterium]